MKDVRVFIIRNFPSFANFYRKLKYYQKSKQLSSLPIQDVFTDVYRKNSWGDSESKSGSGSSLQNTATLRAVLPGLQKELGIRSMLDIPCGDFHWMKEVEVDIEMYLGADIVSELIQSNNQRFGNKTRKFLVLDITKDELPKVDLIFCRDCLIHFSDDDVFRAINNIKKSRSKYLMTTTHTQHTKNENIVTGLWRPINLQIAPFNFPEPLKIINENCTVQGGLLADLSQGLWRIADIPTPN